MMPNIKIKALRLTFASTIVFLIYALLVISNILSINEIQESHKNDLAHNKMRQIELLYRKALIAPNEAQGQLVKLRQLAIELQNMHIKSAVGFTDGIDRALLDTSHQNLTALGARIEALIEEDRMQTAEANQQIEAILYNIGLFTILFIAGNLITTFLFHRETHRSIAEPLNELLIATEEIRTGNLEYFLTPQKVGSHGIPLLMRNFNFMARKLAQSNKQLEKVNRLLAKDADQLSSLAEHRSRFIRQLGHELRAPLSSIGGFSEMMLEGYAGDISIKQEDYLKRIQRSSNNMLAMVNDLVEQAKIQAGTIELNIDAVELEGFFLESWQEFESQVQAAQIDFPKPELVFGDTKTGNFDAQRLRQVITNIIANAIKFTPVQGRIELAASIDNSKQLRICISDTGIGMKKEELERIFEEYLQLDSHSKQLGAGLGLSICQQFITLHKGTIEVKSEPGRGTSFFITIPI